MTDDQELLMYVQGLINMGVKEARIPDYMFKFASEPVQAEAIRLLAMNGMQYQR